MTTRHYWLAPTGEKFYILPSKWHNVSPFHEADAYRHNWQYLSEEYEEPKRTICTKYELVRCLEDNFPELLTTLKSTYSASTELQFYWNTVVQLDRNNADFQSAVQQLGILEEQLDEIFEKIAPITEEG